LEATPQPQAKKDVARTGGESFHAASLSNGNSATVQTFRALCRETGFTDDGQEIRKRMDALPANLTEKYQFG
jgi:hypothetical protein